MILLSTKGKARGYTTRIESTGVDGGPLVTQPERPSPDELLAMLQKLADERCERESRRHFDA